MICYLDTSAAMKLLVEETGSAALTTYLQELRPSDTVSASWLLHTELHCAAGRSPEIVDRDSVTAVLDVVTLVDLLRGDMLVAASMPGRLRSADALHLATALRVGADTMLTYDRELGAAAARAGLAVVTPA